MQATPTHDLVHDRDHSFLQRADHYLALVDLDSYPMHLGREVDHLDLLAHLSRQMQALTAVMWETPDITLKIRTLFTEDHRVGDELTRSGHRVVCDGWIRTTGRLGLTSRDLLLDRARRRSGNLLRTRAVLAESEAHLLVVPSGIYAVTVFTRSSHDGATTESADYNLVLRRYPHPAPRVAPIRLTNAWFYQDENAKPPEGTITSHAKVWGSPAPKAQA